MSTPAAESVVAGGVLMRILGRGVLVTGAPGCGKSRLALEMLDRGHALVADDAPVLRRSADGTLVGEAAEPLRGFLHVRGLGVVDAVEAFGEAACVASQRLDLVVELAVRAGPAPADEVALAAPRTAARYLDVDLPVLHLGGAPPLSPVLLETLVRSFYRDAGAQGAASRLVARQARLLRPAGPDRQAG